MGFKGVREGFQGFQKRFNIVFKGSQHGVYKILDGFESVKRGINGSTGFNRVQQ